MTISTDDNIAQYTGNGVSTAFSFPYLFYANADLKVYLNGALQGSGYTVSGAGAQVGGSVTFSVAPLTGVIVTIERLVDTTQETDFNNFDGNPADVTEKQFDLCVMMTQQNADSNRRSLKYPSTISGITNAVLPTPVDGSALLFSGTTGEIVASADYITDAIADATAGVTGTSLVTATSVTSLDTTGTGSKTWVIQSGRGFAMGQRLRVASDDGTKINEGVVVSYSGTSLVINVDYVSGTGTHADWNISVAGDRGSSGSGSGDMLGAQNLNDVADKPTAFNTIKQSATTTNSGVVELATDAETITGTDTGRAVTPAGLNAVLTNQSVVRVNTANGVGSTNTAIRRFTTTVASAGSDITYADSATLGASFTINTDGVYAINYTDQSGTSQYGFGISLNSAQLTTSIVTITAAGRLAIAYTANNAAPTIASVVIPLSAGDVIRPHNDLVATNGTAALSQFIITRII